MEVNLFTAIIGALGTIIGFLITVATFTRNRDKDVKSGAAEQAIVNTKLDNISNGVESLRVDFKVEQQARAELSERVTRVEESSKQAHHRINKLEGKVDEN